MEDKLLEMKFVPSTIRHLGLNLYERLPHALAELVANAYDADATDVIIKIDGAPGSQTVAVIDNGCGMTFDEINDKFLTIGRNKREDDGNESLIYKRKFTGRKGLGKLALFGIALTMEIESVAKGERTHFCMRWNDIENQKDGSYKPVFERAAEEEKLHGFSIVLRDLKRKSAIDVKGLCGSLSKLFVFSDNNFKVKIISNGVTVELDTQTYYQKAYDCVYTWEIPDDVINFKYARINQVVGKIFFSDKPIPSSSRGVALYAHGRMVNAPSFFGLQASGYAYAYIYGYLEIDFMDELYSDEVKTDRQSLVWENAEPSALQEYLEFLLRRAENVYKQICNRRSQEKIHNVTSEYGRKPWLDSIPKKEKKGVIDIVNRLNESRTSSQTIDSVLKLLSKLIRPTSEAAVSRLDKRIRADVEQLVEKSKYHEALVEGIKSFYDLLRLKTSSTKDGADLVQCLRNSREKQIKLNSDDKKKIDAVLPSGTKWNRLIEDLQQNYLQIIGGKGAGLPDDTIKNAQKCIYHLAMGLTAVRNVVSHTSANQLEAMRVLNADDCLTLLYLLSYMMKTVDRASMSIDIC